MSAAEKLLREIETLRRRVAELERAAAMLLKSEERYRAIIKDIEEGYHEVDLEGDFTFFNESVQRIMGYSAGELLGMNYRRYAADKDNAEKVFEAYNHVFKTGNPITRFEWDIIRKDGSRRTIACSASLMRDSAGRPMGFRSIARDITEQKNSENTLREQSHFLQSLVDSIPNPVFYKDMKGKYLGCNRAFEVFLGKKKEEIVGKTVHEVYPKDLADIYCGRDTELFENPGIQIYEASLTHADGTRHNVIFNKATFSDSGGNPAGLIAVTIDITDKKKAEEALRESENRYRCLFNLSPDGIIMTDYHGNILTVNERALRLTGYGEKEVIGNNVLSFIAPEARTGLIENFRKRLFSHGYAQVETTAIRKNGSPFSADVRGIMLFDAGGKPKEGMIVFCDITDRKETERKVLDSHQRLRSLTSDLLLAEERERKRISAVLHDRIAQLLATVKMRLSLFLENPLSADQADMVAEMRDMVSQSIKETRSLMSEINPPILYELGLAAALERVAEEVSSRYAIPIEVEITGNLQNIDHELAIMVFQVTNEVLTNVGKHSGAREAAMKVHEGAKGISIRVTDDGRGFDIGRIGQPSTEGGFGLYSIRERLSNFKGRIDILSEKGKGTEVIIEIPGTGRNGRKGKQAKRIVQVLTDFSRLPQ